MIGKLSKPAARRWAFALRDAMQWRCHPRDAEKIAAALREAQRGSDGGVV